MHLILGFFAVIVVITIVTVYSQCAALRQEVDDGWRYIEQQLTVRSDIIAPLVTVVRTQAEHEVKLYSDALRARKNAAAAVGPLARGAAETALSKHVSQLLEVGNAQPALQFEDLYQSLTQQLAETETAVEAARPFYNAAVRQLNAKIKPMPVAIIAGFGGIRPRAYFDMALSDAGLASAGV